MKNTAKIFVFILFCSLSSCQQKDIEDYKKSIVKIYITKQKQDFESPWLKLPITYKNHIGVVTKKGILTSAQAIKDARLVQIQLLDDVQKYETELVFKDIESNLALLQIPKDAKKKLKKLKVKVTELNLKDKYKMLYLDETTQAAIEKVTINRVETESVANTLRSQTVYDVSFSKKSLLRGEALLHEGKLAGFTVGKGKEQASVVPGFVIAHFLKDKHNDKYRGFPGLAVVTDLIRDKVRLESMGLDPSTKGVVVSHVLAQDADENRLLKDDVIVAIDGHSLDELGQIDHSVWGKINFKYLFDKKYGGDKIRMDVFRNGEKKKLNFDLKRFSSNIALIRSHSTPEDAFLIAAGFVFQELSLEYLTIFGSDWYQKAPLHLVYKYQVDNFDPKFLGQRKVILNKVLPDRVNRGYNNMKNLVVAKVNGQAPTSMENFKEIVASTPLQKNGKNYLVVEFEDTEETIIIDYDRLKQSEARIAKTYLN